MLKVTRKSPMTGKETTLELDVTEAQIEAYYEFNLKAQDAFPKLTPSEREFIMTGYTDDDWLKMFPPEEEDA